MSEPTEGHGNPDDDIAAKRPPAGRYRSAGPQADAVNAIEEGHIQLSDREQLRSAAAEGRRLATRNVRHFIGLTKDAIVRQEPHAGIVLCSMSCISDQCGSISRNAWRGVSEGGRT